METVTIDSEHGRSRKRQADKTIASVWMNLEGLFVLYLSINSWIFVGWLSKSFPSLLEGIMTVFPVKKNYLAMIIGVAVLLALSSCASKSRHRHMGPPPMKSPEQIMATMNERLQLTEEQEREVYPIIEELVERRNWAFETYGKRGEKDQKKLMDEMAEIQKSIETQLRNVLTERQMMLYQLYHEKEHQKMMGEKGPRSGQHP